jgi:hypothetical protein
MYEERKRETIVSSLQLKTIDLRSTEAVKWTKILESCTPRKSKRIFGILRYISFEASGMSNQVVVLE